MIKPKLISFFRKEIIENLIEIRRQNKEQRQQEKDEQEDNTEKLNNIFVNLQKSGNLLFKTKNSPLSQKTETKKLDENLDAYDNMVIGEKRHFCYLLKKIFFNIKTLKRFFFDF